VSVKEEEEEDLFNDPIDGPREDVKDGER